jgi:hypothetical protein
MKNLRIDLFSNRMTNGAAFLHASNITDTITTKRSVSFKTKSSCVEDKTWKRKRKKKLDTGSTKFCLKSFFSYESQTYVKRVLLCMVREQQSSEPSPNKPTNP